MYFEELTIKEKVEFTVNYIKNKKALAIKGQEDADKYIKRKLKARKNIGLKC